MQEGGEETEEGVEQKNLWDNGRGWSRTPRVDNLPRVSRVLYYARTQRSGLMPTHAVVAFAAPYSVAARSPPEIVARRRRVHQRPLEFCEISTFDEPQTSSIYPDDQLSSGSPRLTRDRAYWGVRTGLGLGLDVMTRTKLEI